ncbi:hypothetical protein PpBr36_08244 [Pyricularia pennisetigena]|uniref:hypothetical protein n=1 Tax=Pyricularia pennisetigena TaxID=1578925 RepID=UPI0011523EEB|nr:hypothetical protein PpBr36_08244 [Pyricularia pennisetigena]TLS23926.1 hypothetical protein PpBr36_08244 [Pyricularia pennisetigena]
MSASLAPECNEVKERYDTCFLKWYSEKYLRGAGTSNKNECESLFNDYQKCLGVALKKKGIDKLLDEAREDNKDNDATHMGRSIASRPTHRSPPPFFCVQHRLDTRTGPRWRLPHTTPELDSSSSSERTIPAVARAEVALPTVSLPLANKLPRASYPIYVCGYTLVAEASGQIQSGPAMRF